MSRLERDVECGGALVFPRSPKDSAHAGFGSVVHDFLMRVPQVGRELALEQVADDRHRAALEDLELDGLPLDAGAYAQEVALAFNVDTGEARELCRGKGRPDYRALGVGPDDAVGTLDVLGCTREAVVVIDYKTGWADLGPVKSNWQLRGCALLAARAFGRERAVLAVIRLKPGGEEHFVDRAELGPMDLDIVEEALRELAVRKRRMRALDDAGEPVPTKQGRWCTYCPSYDFCPAKMNMLAVAASPVELERPRRQAYLEPVLTPQTFPDALAFGEQLNAIAKRYWERLEEAAAASPYELGDGWFFGQKELVQESIDVDAGTALLTSWLGADMESAVETKRTLSKDAARKVIARRFRGKTDPATGKRLRLGEVFELFLESLREAGAMRTRVSHPVMKFRKAQHGIGDGSGREQLSSGAEAAGEAAEGGRSPEGATAQGDAGGGAGAIEQPGR